MDLNLPGLERVVTTNGLAATPRAGEAQPRDLAQALHSSEERYEILASIANDGIWDWDLTTSRIVYSDRWKEILGYDLDEISDNPNEWFVRVHPDDIELVHVEIEAHLDGSRLQLECRHRLLHKNGSYRWVFARGRVCRDANDVAYRVVGALTDITDRQQAEEELVRRAFYDSLTGLPNRALFMDHLGRAVELARRRSSYKFAILFIDLDRFKIINDSLGHQAGDALLVSLAQRLENALRRTDLLARLSGDEFAIVMDQIHGVWDARIVADRIQADLTKPFDIDGHTIFTSASIGIAMSNGHYQSPEELLRNADVAMYKAKAAGKARYEIYDSAMHTEALRLLHIENDLRGASDRNELAVHYQPIVSIPTGALVGFEALVRWAHPTRGLIPPGEFVPIAEETGLIIGIDRWVLREACQTATSWERMGPELSKLTVSVNLSSRQFLKGDLTDYVRSVLDETGLEPTRLKLEITESALVENPDAVARQLVQLKEMGIGLLIDDFGTGYSSLSYLHRFPFDTIKIDRSFVGGMAVSGDANQNLTRSIVILAQNLNLAVVAEGVETVEQLAILSGLSCEYGQGYYFSRPLDAGALPTYLADTATAWR